MKRLRWWRKPKKHSNEADLGRYFAALRKQSHHDSFADVRSWLTEKASNTEEGAQHQKMPLSPMKVFVINHRKRLILTSLFLAITIVSCTTPVEQEDTVGHMITGVIDGPQALNASLSIAGLDWMKPEYLEQGLISGTPFLPVSSNKTVAVDSIAASEVDRRFVIALPQTAESQASAWAYDLKLIEGIREVEVSPLQISVEKPAYKVVLNSIWSQKGNLEINADPAQLQYAIHDHLEALEMHGVEVNQVMDAKGNYVLSLTPPEDINHEGLSTLKHFLSKIHNGAITTKQGSPLSSAEAIELLQQKIMEIESEMADAPSEAARQKQEYALKQMTAKLAALKDAQEKQ